MNLRTRGVWLPALVVLLLSAGCGGGDSDGSEVSATASTEAAEVASPQELTDAYGEIAGLCFAAQTGAPLDAKDIAVIRDDLDVLAETAAIDPEAPTADQGGGFTVSDALFDSVRNMKGCDPALEAELDHILDSLP